MLTQSSRSSSHSTTQSRGCVSCRLCLSSTRMHMLVGTTQLICHRSVRPWTYIYWTASSALYVNEFDFAPAVDISSCLLPASPVEYKWRSSCTDQNVKKRWQQLLHAIVDCACTSAKCRGLSTEGNRMESPFAACHHWHK